MDVSTGTPSFLFKEILQQSSEAVFCFDSGNNILFWNKRMEKLFSIQETDAAGKNAAEILSFLFQPDKAKEMFQLVLGGSEIHDKKKIIFNTGNVSKEICLDIKILTLAFGEENIRYGVGILKDENELEKSEALLKEREEELESLIYKLSHEVKTPIYSIGAFLKSLEDRFKDDENDNRYKECLKFENKIEQMIGLINGLLEFIRINRTEMIIREVNINLIIEQLVNQYHDVIVEKKVTVQVLKPFPLLNTDSGLIKMIFSELIDNAIKFIEIDREPLIEIDYTLNGNFIIFLVKDNGKGFPKKFTEKVFNLFFQADHFNTRGNGLGLAVAKNAVKKLGGAIWSSSKENIGASFFFSIPVDN